MSQLLSTSSSGSGLDLHCGRGGHLRGRPASIPDYLGQRKRVQRPYDERCAPVGPQDADSRWISEFEDRIYERLPPDG
jgi:hypothetical protein